MSRATAEEELRDYARLQVRAGLLEPDAMLAEVRGAVASQLPHQEAEVLARAWIAAARRDLAARQGTWPDVTDHDRLQAAFAECEEHDVPVRQGVEDHWVVKAELERRTGLRGILWFTQPDVWHAVDHGMLELNLWHPTTANVAPGDHLLDAVLSCLARHGLQARFDEGRIEVAMHWQRRA